jgi:hypothetical protein
VRWGEGEVGGLVAERGSDQPKPGSDRDVPGP